MWNKLEKSQVLYSKMNFKSFIDTIPFFLKLNIIEAYINLAFKSDIKTHSW
jgi:hypothetical protein